VSKALRDIVRKDAKARPRWLRPHRKFKGGYEPEETEEREAKILKPYYFTPWQGGDRPALKFPVDRLGYPKGIDGPPCYDVREWEPARGGYKALWGKKKKEIINGRIGQMRKLII